MTENFGPLLESCEWNIRPYDGNETIKKKSDDPTVVPNNF